MSPFSCRLWSGGRLMMKRLSLLFTRFFSELSGAGGVPGGRAGLGGSPQPRALTLSLPPSIPSPTWGPGPLGDPGRLILVPAELRQVPAGYVAQPPQRHIHGVLQVLVVMGGGSAGKGGRPPGSPRPPGTHQPVDYIPYSPGPLVDRGLVV